MSIPASAQKIESPVPRSPMITAQLIALPPRWRGESKDDSRSSPESGPREKKTG